MSGVRGDARKRQQESQPDREVPCVCGAQLVRPYPNDTEAHSTTECPEVGLTEAEQEALQSGYWTSLASTLNAVARIKADAIAQERAAWVAKIEALADECSSPWLDSKVRALLSSDATEAGTQ